jgi:hypothetical protein
MVAGLETVDNSRLGRLASIVRELKGKPNPVHELRTYFTPPDTLTGVSGDLGRVVSENALRQNGMNEPVQDEGLFKDDFILDALEAGPDTVGTLLRPAPNVTGYGWLRWQWLVTALATELLAGLLGGLLLRWDRRRYPQRYHRRMLQQLPNDDAREAYRIVQALESRRNRGENVYPLLADAERVLEQYKRLGVRDPDSDLRQQLADLTERAKLTQQAYRELGGQ